MASSTHSKEHEYGGTAALCHGGVSKSQSLTKPSEEDGNYGVHFKVAFLFNTPVSFKSV